MADYNDFITLEHKQILETPAEFEARIKREEEQKLKILSDDATQAKVVEVKTKETGTVKDISKKTYVLLDSLLNANSISDFFKILFNPTEMFYSGIILYVFILIILFLLI